MKKRWTALLLIISGTFLTYVAYTQWDVCVAYYCRNLSRSVLDIGEIITTLGDSKWYFMMLVPAFLIFYFIVKNKNRYMKILFLLVAISASGLVNTLIKWVAGRNRPINLFDHGLFGFDYFEAIYELNSFPSGHTVTVFSLAAALSMLFPRFGFLAFIPAVVIALSRVIITSHFVSDVIAGAVVGILCALAVKYYFDRFEVELRTRSEVD